MEPQSSRPLNRLSQSRSPYLLQHADNPVDWREWGEDAFAEARERDVPIFLSIGYSTCHWCHVMAHESFEDDAIAAEMNARFVNVKVDREERPDVDRIYMAYVQSLTGSGGWPMSVWLTPELKPFYGGTYFPPENRYGRIGFAELIVRISSIWRERRAELEQQGNRFLDTVNESVQGFASGGAELDGSAAEKCLEELVQQFDDKWGGFGGAPKFPMTGFFSFLLEMGEIHGWDEGKRTLLGVSLDRLADGGIRDFLAGGFHRYSVDRYWHVPHFEKMLYDQGQLAEVFAESARLLDRIDDLATGQEIVNYVDTQLRSEAGGIYSAEDADSPLPGDPANSGEGAFYVWSAAEIDNALDVESAKVFKAQFGVEESGNARGESDPHGDFRGLNILTRTRPIEAIAEECGLDRLAVSESLRASISKLNAIRSQRPRPHLDDKVLSSWNGLMISGACRVFQAGGDRAAIELATAAGAFIWENLYDESDNLLYRAFRIERRDTPGFAEDYASCCLAFINLYESTGEEMWLDRAERLMKRLIDSFWDDSSHGFFATPEGATSLIARLKDDYDGAEPSANSLAALALIRLGALLGDPKYDDYARQTIEAFRYQWTRAPRAMPLMLVALTRLMRPVQQIVIFANRDDPMRALLQESAFAGRKLHSVILYLGDGSNWLANRNPNLGIFGNEEERATAYLCENYTCKLPAYDGETLRSQLSAS